VAQAAEDQGLVEGVKVVAGQMRPKNLEPKLEEAMQNQPLLPQLLSFRVVGTAVAIAAVVALILYVLMSPILAGLGLVVAFFASWFVLATRGVDKSRPVSSERDDASSDDEDE
jgi:Flp pilus assembly protein TadB